MMIDASRPLILIGAGGHAKSLQDALISQNLGFTHYVDVESKGWADENNIVRMHEEALAKLLASGPQLVMGFVGADVASLQKRLQLMRDYQSKGATFPAIIHASAIVSTKATLAAGINILAGAVLNGYSSLAEGVIVNTAAVIEHDAQIGAGTHIAPRSVVLGGAKVGDCCYIGSNAVMVQNSTVASNQFIKSLTVHI
ncbi:MAG: hypothetical protein SFT92_08950 [Rickettsiales bacterium]|nr:hypothetical protein [Rickettsiales bacterium]